MQSTSLSQWQEYISNMLASFHLDLTSVAISERSGAQPTSLALEHLLPNEMLQIDTIRISNREVSCWTEYALIIT